MGINYPLLTMREIADLPKNGYKACSTFSGCGGSCLGFEMAGFQVLWANEFISSARETYSANHPNVILDGRDIRFVKAEDILAETNLKRGELDVLEGSPPCSDFSMAGKRHGSFETATHKVRGREKEYSDGAKQQVDDLFFEFARILNGLQPKVFVAENVKGLTLGKAKKLLGDCQLDLFGDSNQTIYHTLINCGYRVAYKVLNANHYGVAQARERLIIMGVRSDFNIDPHFPTPLPGRAPVVADALEDVVNSSKDINDACYNGRSEVAKVVSQLSEGQTGSDVKGSGSYFNLVRIDRSKPCPTILQMQGRKNACLVHWSENRELTIPELKRLHSFPDDFILAGSFQQRCERIGRSVPPKMMYQVALCVKEILDKINKGGK